MLSFGPSGKLTGQLVAVQVDEGRWAELSLSRSKAASFALRHEDVVYELAAQVTRAPADFHRTRLVTLLPRYVLLNSTPFDLVVGQAGHDAWFLMPRHRPHSPAQRLVWHWPSARHKRRLCVKVLDADGSEWLPCAPFKLGGGGGASSGLRCLIKSRHPSEPRKLRVLGVHLEVVDGVCFVKLCEARAHEMPLMISNNTSAPIRAVQSRGGGERVSRASSHPPRVSRRRSASCSRSPVAHSSANPRPPTKQAQRRRAPCAPRSPPPPRRRASPPPPRPRAPAAAGGAISTCRPCLGRGSARRGRRRRGAARAARRAGRGEAGGVEGEGAGARCLRSTFRRVGGRPRRWRRGPAGRPGRRRRRPGPARRRRRCRRPCAAFWRGARLRRLAGWRRRRRCRRRCAAGSPAARSPRRWAPTFAASPSRCASRRRRA
ncbi:hypothetical protein EMIHUDRAFT_453400, partial [Emiliania huxleyi CCMP1516]|uniref:Vacuolar protein sorting-associated protein 13 VPS13 adaptor binding domain-containing protein n=2 Tax=Emiliania huxleyi TaxID=2903 RepID=A0A0D3I693_EMIH1